MNKNIKGIIAFGLTLGALTAFNLNAKSSTAYAASSDADEITGLTVEQTDGDEIDLYTDKDYDDELEDDMEEGETYYGESETRKITIELDDDIDDDYVRVFVGSKEYDIDDKIPLSTTGTTTIKIRVYEEEYDSDESYRSSEYNQYILRIKYEDADDNDEFDKINIQDYKGNKLDIYKDENYKTKLTGRLKEDETYYVKTTTRKITIDSDDTDVDDDNVRIFNGSTNYEIGESINLTTKNTTLKVRVYDDEYDESEDYSRSDYDQYILKINYGDDNSEVYMNNEGSDKTAVNGNPKTPDQDYTIVASQNSSKYNSIGWQYINGSWYYREPDGSFATGWKLVYGNWYYIDSFGIMQTGWKYVNGLWYYLESTGKMHTGWIKLDGKWYYLYSSGAMASNTWVDGYRLGPDGAWIK